MWRWKSIGRPITKNLNLFSFKSANWKQNSEFISDEKRFNSRMACSRGHECAGIKWKTGKERENISGLENDNIFYEIISESS